MIIKLIRILSRVTLCYWNIVALKYFVYRAEGECMKIIQEALIQMFVPLALSLSVLPEW